MNVVNRRIQQGYISLPRQWSLLSMVILVGPPAEPAFWFPIPITIHVHVQSSSFKVIFVYSVSSRPLKSRRKVTYSANAMDDLLELFQVRIESRGVESWACHRVLRMLRPLSFVKALWPYGMLCISIYGIASISTDLPCSLKWCLTHWMEQRSFQKLRLGYIPAAEERLLVDSRQSENYRTGQLFLPESLLIRPAAFLLSQPSFRSDSKRITAASGARIRILS